VDSDREIGKEIYLKVVDKKRRKKESFNNKDKHSKAQGFEERKFFQEL
jgi:hypothetical protein